MNSFKGFKPPERIKTVVRNISMLDDSHRIEARTQDAEISFRNDSMLGITEYLLLMLEAMQQMKSGSPSSNGVRNIMVTNNTTVAQNSIYNLINNRKFSVAVGSNTEIRSLINSISSSFSGTKQVEEKEIDSYIEKLQTQLLKIVQSDSTTSKKSSNEIDDILKKNDKTITTQSFFGNISNFVQFKSLKSDFDIISSFSTQKADFNFSNNFSETKLELRENLSLEKIEISDKAKNVFSESFSISSIKNSEFASKNIDNNVNVLQIKKLKLSEKNKSSSSVNQNSTLKKADSFIEKNSFEFRDFLTKSVQLSQLRTNINEINSINKAFNSLDLNNISQSENTPAKNTKNIANSLLSFSKNIKNSDFSYTDLVTNNFISLGKGKKGSNEILNKSFDSKIFQKENFKSFYSADFHNIKSKTYFDNKSTNDKNLFVAQIEKSKTNSLAQIFSEKGLDRTSFSYLYSRFFEMRNISNTEEIIENDGNIDKNYAVQNSFNRYESIFLENSQELTHISKTSEASNEGEPTVNATKENTTQESHLIENEIIESKKTFKSQLNTINSQFGTAAKNILGIINSSIKTTLKLTDTKNKAEITTQIPNQKNTETIIENVQSFISKNIIPPLENESKNRFLYDYELNSSQKKIFLNSINNTTSKFQSLENTMEERNFQAFEKYENNIKSDVFNNETKKTINEKTAETKIFKNNTDKPSNLTTTYISSFFSERNHDELIFNKQINQSTSTALNNAESLEKTENKLFSTFNESFEKSLKGFFATEKNDFVINEKSLISSKKNSFLSYEQNALIFNEKNETNKIEHINNLPKLNSEIIKNVLEKGFMQKVPSSSRFNPSENDLRLKNEYSNKYLSDYSKQNVIFKNGSEKKGFQKRFMLEEGSSELLLNNILNQTNSSFKTTVGKMIFKNKSAFLKSNTKNSFYAVENFNSVKELPSNIYGSKISTENIYTLNRNKSDNNISVLTSLVKDISALKAETKIKTDIFDQTINNFAFQNDEFKQSETNSKLNSITNISKETRIFLKNNYKSEFSSFEPNQAQNTINKHFSDTMEFDSDSSNTYITNISEQLENQIHEQKNEIIKISKTKPSYITLSLRKDYLSTNDINTFFKTEQKNNTQTNPIDIALNSYVQTSETVLAQKIQKSFSDASFINDHMVLALNKAEANSEDENDDFEKNSINPQNNSNTNIEKTENQINMSLIYEYVTNAINKAIEKNNEHIITKEKYLEKVDEICEKAINKYEDRVKLERRIRGY